MGRVKCVEIDYETFEDFIEDMKYDALDYKVNKYNYVYIPQDEFEKWTNFWNDIRNNTKKNERKRITTIKKQYVEVDKDTFFKLTNYFKLRWLSRGYFVHYYTNYPSVDDIAFYKEDTRFRRFKPTYYVMKTYYERFERED